MTGNTRNLSIATMPDLNEFMTTQETAEKLGFHVKSIPKMLRDKILDGERWGRDWLVYKKSVDAYLKKTKGMSKTDPRRKAKT
ncbi:MAG: excisionase family DNA-binding protein [Anaerolineales bacterium]|nr:excisionase family DNA-binding protein [Anaerolineales bacterium]